MPRTIRTFDDPGQDREIDYLHKRIDDLLAQIAALKSPSNSNSAAAIAASVTQTITEMLTGPAGGDLAGTYPDPTVPEVRDARNSLTYGLYASLSERLEAIESALVACGCAPTIGPAGGPSLDFSAIDNSMYAPWFV